MLENKFKTKLKKELESRFDGCIVTHMDAGDIQGIPDLLILYNDRWATLEGKKNANASHRPNQDYYVKKMNNMSFSTQAEFEKNNDGEGSFPKSHSCVGVSTLLALKMI